jgi:hypothetical protein
LHAFIHALRNKIESDPRRPALIVNEARVGYRLGGEPGGPGRHGVGEQASDLDR